MGIISSPKFWRNGLCCSHVLIRTELQSTTQNSFKLHHRCFYEGALKLLRRKLWKISRKLYVIEFSFKKIVRLHSTAYYRIKNPLQILFWSCRLFKGVLKLLENLQEKSCDGVPFSKLQVFKLQPLALPCMFLKFWKIPEIRVLWSSFLQKQALTSSFRIAALKSFFGKIPGRSARVLKKNSTLYVSLERMQKFSGKLFFQNTTKSSNNLFLKHQRTRLDEWKGNRREISICSKIVLMS